MREVDPSFGSGPGRWIVPWLECAGARYWAASLLPAVVGTTLAFWLRRPDFLMRWLPALEFLLATLLVHAGFSLLHAVFTRTFPPSWQPSWLIGVAGVLLVAACLLGIHLNGSLPRHRFVPPYIFIVYGLATLFAGVLYVLPPFSFSQRAGGEIILAEGLGMIPVLGAFLIQVGDLNRTVYLAAVPLTVATGIWVWVDEIMSLEADRTAGRGTMVILFGAGLSVRIVLPALSVLFVASLLLANGSGSLNPWALITLLLSGLLWKMVKVSWCGHADMARMLGVRRQAFLLHLATCLLMAASSMATILS